MRKPDVVLLTAITTFIANRGETTPGEIAEVFDIKVDEAIEAIKIINLTEVTDRAGRYFLDFHVDAKETEDGTDVIYSADDRITYFPTDYDDPRVYLTLGESAVSIEMIDQLLKLSAQGSESAQSLLSVREKIRQAVGGSIGAEPPTPRGSDQVLETVWTSLRHSRMLAFDYHGPAEFGERVTQRSVIPCAVVSEAEGYLAALQGKSHDLRWFRLDRMSNATVGEEFTQTDANRARRKLRNHPELHPTEGDDVVFRVEPQAIWFAESTPGATVTDNGDSIDITFRAVSPTWVRNSAIKVGTDLIDIFPAEVKDEVVKQARRILEIQ